MGHSLLGQQSIFHNFAFTVLCLHPGSWQEEVGQDPTGWWELSQFLSAIVLSLDCKGFEEDRPAG